MIISSIQRATNYIYHPILQKISQMTPADWKEKTMLTGLIISVCCAVITFFTQTTFICGAFAMLSGICGLGTLYMRHYENCKKMQEQIETFQQENHTLAIENEKLQTEVTKLTVHTGLLTKTSQDLIISVENLRVNLVVLEPIVKGSQETEKKLSAFSIKMHKQQQVSQGLMELISNTMAERPGQLALEQEILNQLQSLQSNDTTLEKVKELNLIREQLFCVHDKLRNALKEYADIQSKMAETSNQLFYMKEQSCLENTRLQEIRQELSAVSNELKNTQVALKALLSENRALA